MFDFHEEQGDDQDFEFDDRADGFACAITIPAPPPLEALGDSGLDESP